MSETQMEQKGHPQSFLPPKPQVPEAGSHASHIGKRETIHEASDAFSAHSDMLRSLSVPEARALTSSDGGHVLPLYPSVQLFMNPQNLSENRDKTFFRVTVRLIRLFTHNLLQAVIG